MQAAEEQHELLTKMRRLLRLYHLPAMTENEMPAEKLVQDLQVMLKEFVIDAADEVTLMRQQSLRLSL